MSHIVFRVVEITEEADDVRSLRMVRADGQALKPYPAGSHIDVFGPTGVLRQYSLCMPPDDPESILIAVKREQPSRGGSSALHEVQVGDLLKVSKPRNLLALAPEAEQHLLIAGGIGVTPLLSMAYELYRRGAEFQLHYFARSRDQAAFADLLEHRVEFPDRVHLHFGVGRAGQPEVFAGLAAAQTAATHVYVCGPEGFMANVESAFAPVLGAGQLHSEHFVAAETDTSEDRPFTVQLDSGEEFQIPADRSILAVLEQNGIEVFKSCEEGICGSCVSGVLEGTPEHRDNCLTEADRKSQMALCVSRARSDKLVIELY